MAIVQGSLNKVLPGRWVIRRPRQASIEIPSGDVFRVEVEVKSELESWHHSGPLKSRTQGAVRQILLRCRLAAQRRSSRRDRRVGYVPHLSIRGARCPRCPRRKSPTSKTLAKVTGSQKG